MFLLLLLQCDCHVRERIHDGLKRNIKVTEKFCDDRKQLRRGKSIIDAKIQLPQKNKEVLRIFLTNPFYRTDKNYFYVEG